jgi:hypothetical protein
MVRLRYQGQNLEVPDGEFFIGRSSACQLALDDHLVSRKHALLLVDGSKATVEDLGSRNGVNVNGRRIGGRTSLGEGDIILIGSQTLRIYGLDESAAPPESMRRIGRFDTMVADEGMDEPTITHGTPLAPGEKINELSLIGNVAEKALGLGRVDDATRLLERPLLDLLDRCRRVLEGDTSAPVDANTAKRAAELALRLATESKQARFVDYMIDLAAARRELLPMTTVDELYSLVRVVKIDVAGLRAYVNELKTARPNPSANERFLLSRIEGLEQLASLK